MDWTLVISAALQVVAAVWAGVVLARMKNWQASVLFLLFSLMALRRIIDLAGGSDPESSIGPISMRTLMQGVVLVISVVSVAAVGFLHYYLHHRAEGDREVRFLATALADSATPTLISDADPGPSGLVIEFVNDAMLDLTGFTRDEMVGRTMTEVFGLEEGYDTPARVKSAVAGGFSVVTECTIRRKDGTLRWVTCSMSPIRDPSGRNSRLLWVKHDIGGRRIAEAELRAALQKLSFHVDNSPLAVIEWDRDFRVGAWSSGAERIFGWAASEVIGRHPSEWRIVHEADAEHVAGVIERLNTGAEPRNLCLNRNYTKSGEVIWCQWYNSVLFDPSGRVNSVVSLAQDVTERHRAEERQRLLMLELDHRVKNNLATVLGIAQQSLAASTSLDGFASAFVGRVESLARAHGLLAKASWEGVDLHELCRRVLETGMVGGTPQIQIAGPAVSLSSSQGSILALTMHELMTNAVKYGALSCKNGTVALEWIVENSGGFPTLNIVWAERGGPAVSRPVRAGFGTTFIETGISYELGGKAEMGYDVTGLRCRIVIPLSSEPLPATGAPTATGATA